MAVPQVEELAPRLGLVVGDLSLAAAEEELARQWPACLDRKPRAIRVLSASWRALSMAATENGAALVLVDVGPNLGALNRTALLASDCVVVPLAPDLRSLQGLRDLEPMLRRWRGEWAERRERNPVGGLELPQGAMRPAGYIVMRHAVRMGWPARVYDRRLQRLPGLDRETVLGESTEAEIVLESDPHCLAVLKRYPSLTSLAREARKPMFALKPADGAIGGHAKAVQDALRDFRDLARAVAMACGVALP